MTDVQDSSFVEKPEDRRKYRRIAAAVKVTYTILSDASATPCEYGDTVTEDISEGGLCMLIHENVKEGQLVYVNIQVPTHEASLLMLAKTVHVDPDAETGRNRVCMKFVGMLPVGLRSIMEQIEAAAEDDTA